MRIGVCDDLQEAREMLVEMVKHLYPEEEVITYKDGGEVLDETNLPDILLLDIQMSGINGMDTAKRLRQTDKKMLIIFVTAMEEYVFEAFDVDAFHYLVKPFTEEKFEEVFRKAVRELAERTEMETDTKKEMRNFIIKSKDGHVAINLEEIVYAEVFNRKVVIHTLREKIEYYGKLKDLEKMAGKEFYRSHRSYLVNLAFVRKYDAKTIYLEKGEVPMAKQNYPEFVKCYLRYNQRRRR